MEHIVLEALEQTGTAPLPEPRPTLVKELLGEELSGQLVRVQATVRVPALSTNVVLEDGTGKIRLYLPDRFLDDPALAETLASGTLVSVIGIAEQRDSQPGWTPDTGCAR